MEEITIRPARQKDVEAMVQLQRAAVEKHWRLIIGRNFDDFLASRLDPEIQIKKYRERVIDPNRVIVVAEQNGKLVGFAGMAPQGPEDYPHGYTYQLSAIYTDPDYEGRNIGTALMTHMLDTLKQKSVSNLSLWCLAGNRRAHDFYEKCGGKLITDTPTPPEYNEVAPHIAYGWDVTS